jgi:adenylate kinase family enzyme
LKRFETYNKETMQVVEYYRGRAMLVEVDADDSVEGIFGNMVKGFREFGVD